MEFVRAASIHDLDSTGRLLVEVDGCEVGLFRIDGQLHAYENRCPHLAGPVCSGKVARRVEAHVQDDGDVVEHFSEREVSVVCPWHGYEFDIRSGTCWADKRLRLRTCEVQIHGDEIHVRLPAAARTNGAGSSALPGR
jgi:nitrite reductase/ring-hydroxylating ferredoxin subunit